MKIKVTAQPLEAIKADALVVLHEEGFMLAKTDNDYLSRHLDSYRKAVEKKKSKREWFCNLEKEAQCATTHLLLDSASFRPELPHDESLKTAAARAVGLCEQYSLRKVAFAVHHELAADKAPGSAVFRTGAISPLRRNPGSGNFNSSSRKNDSMRSRRLSRARKRSWRRKTRRGNLSTRPTTI